jgi:reversibly glycosylated polypeptide / UDP-arabinopyranose mutase
MNVTIVVPTIREERIKDFLFSWKDQISAYQAKVLIVCDTGDSPTVEHLATLTKTTPQAVLGQDNADLIYNKNDGVRNLGFAYIAKYMSSCDMILTLDDDCYPDGDTIGNHIRALEKNYPISFFSHCYPYTRGFPYAIRDEARCVVSHGVWRHSIDWDAPTELVNNPTNLQSIYQGPIPKGPYFQFCGMNVAFRKEVLPWMYFAPMGKKLGVQRFADIWCGYKIKKYCDNHNLAIVTGMSTVNHMRASNVFDSLVAEAPGIKANEHYWEESYRDEYKDLHDKQAERWAKLMCDMMGMEYKP